MQQARETEAVLRVNRLENKVVVFEDAAHGFSVSIDQRNERLAEQAVEAEVQALERFIRCSERVCCLAECSPTSLLHSPLQPISRPPVHLHL